MFPQPHWKRSSHITHSCFCRDDGNEDAIMAELCDSLHSEDEEDGEEDGTTNGLGDAIAKVWSMRAKKLHHDYSITVWALSVYPKYTRMPKLALMESVGRLLNVW